MILCLFSVFIVVTHTIIKGSSEPYINTVFERVNHTTVLSCGLPDLGPKKERSWMVSDEELSSIPGYREINPNGSLTIRFQLKDSNLLYSCEAVVPNSNLEPERYLYMFSPIVEAFLSETVQNVTLDWGSVYTFPCIFAGTLPREDKMIFNNREVNHTQHNVTENSVVECYVRNEYGSQHHKAFITVRPGSEAWAQKFGPPSGEYCQPYSLALNESSVCRRYLDEVSAADPRNQPYLVSRSCLSSAGHVEQAIGQLFMAWDQLLADKQSTAGLAEPIDWTNSSFAAWRCVDWAKRLTCAMAYPRCRSLHPGREAANPANQFFENYPICQSHCLAVTGLLCLASLDTRSNTSALDPLIYADSQATGIVETGWSRLLSVPEAQNERLPFADLAKQQQLHSQQDGAVFTVVGACSRSTETEVNGRTSAWPDSCTHLPLESDEYRRPEVEARPMTESSGATVASAAHCLSGNGLHYRGSSSMPNCLPWAAFYAQVGTTSVQHAVDHMWPGLSALTYHTFPHSLDTETSSSAACRNPLGLAPTPFCLGPAVPELPSAAPVAAANGSLDRWTIILCDNIAPCSSTNDSALYELTRVDLDKDPASELSEAQAQRIIACALVASLICLLVIGYLIWRFRRCGPGSTGSSLCLSVLDFPETSDQKAATMVVQDRDKLLAGTSITCHDLDGTKQQRDLERRRQLLNRRRRLRQLHPSGQCIASCCYRIGDFLLCRMHPPLSEVNRIIDTPSGIPTDIASENPARVSQKSTFWEAFRLCGFGRAREKSGTGVVSATGLRGPFSSEKPLPVNSTTTSQHRAVPIGSTDDEEFEANTLSMQLQKHVAYVANAGADGRARPSAGRSCLHRVCASCGAALQLTSSMCLACQKTVHLSDGKQPAAVGGGTGDYGSNVVLHQTSHGANNTSAEVMDDYPDPGFALTQSSMQILDSASATLGAEIMPEKLFNLASMTQLLHPKVKEVCYPRNRLIEHQRLSKRAFGWVILAEAPNLHHVVRRHRMLSVTTAERLGLADPSEQGQTNEQQPDPVPDNSSEGPLIVVKMLNDEANPETQANFLREAEILVELCHKNVIQLLGVCVPLKPPSLLFEYMPYGDLTTLLRHYARPGAREPIRPLHNSMHAMNGELICRVQTVRGETTATGSKQWTPPTGLSQSHLLAMALDACDAMIYLSDKYYVHRDVATRSFLVGNRFVVKLSDFALCRPIKPNVDFVAKPDECVPIKWLPLESIINGLFHIDTDVWSFGVFLWELFSFALEPYGDLSCDQVVSFLEAEKRLSCPTDCPPAVHELMLQCWSSRRADRPSFCEIRSYLTSQRFR